MNTKDLLPASEQILSIYQNKEIDQEAIASITLASATIEILTPQIEEEYRVNWLLKSAVGYSMIGDFQAARRILSQINLAIFEKKPDFVTIIATIDPNKLEQFSWQNVPSPFLDYIEAINQVNRGEKDYEDLETLLIQCIMQSEDLLAHSLLRGCRQTLRAIRDECLPC